MKIGNVVMFLCITIILFPLTAHAENVRNAEYAVSLEQNYPNPFSDTTEIDYKVSSSSDSCIDSVFVELIVFDVLGQHIDTLVSGFQCIDKKYTVTWDGSNKKGEQQPSGIFFYQIYIRSAGLTCTKKMIRMR